MPLWDWIPPYAEEQTINPEIEQIQEKLSKFKQLIPDGFVELEQLNWMCSTQGWKEPSCERYNCLINGEWKQVDIRHTLLERLELTNNIPYPVYISPTVLNKGSDRYLAYNVEKEEEMFLQKPFTVKNLEEDINELLEKIGKLEREKRKLEKKNKEQEEKINQKDNEITRLENRITEIKRERDNRPTQQQLNDIKQELELEKNWWDKWIKDSADKQFDFGSREAGYIQESKYNRWDIYRVPLGTGSFISGIATPKSLSENKKLVKKLYEYYKNQ